MLINEKDQQVQVPAGKDLSDSAKRLLREVHAPLPYQHHPFFRLDQPTHRYRIAKPKPMYRVARMLSYNKKGSHLVICYAYQDIKQVETSTYFKGWITDWIEYDNQLP